MRKTITLTAHNRPHYLRRVIDALRRNALEGYSLYCQLEPGCGECLEICRTIDFLPCEVIVNKCRLGVRENPYALLARVFEQGSAFNVYLEDDVVLSPDAFDLANWFAQLQHAYVLCLCFMNYGSNSDDPLRVTTGSFNALGFCLTNHAWNTYFAPHWHADERGWDWSITSLHAAHPELRVLQPTLGRSNHIGRTGGTFCTPEFHDRVFAGQTISDRRWSGSFSVV